MDSRAPGQAVTAALVERVLLLARLGQLRLQGVAGHLLLGQSRLAGPQGGVPRVERAAPLLQLGVDGARGLGHGIDLALALQELTRAGAEGGAEFGGSGVLLLVFALELRAQGIQVQVGDLQLVVLAFYLRGAGFELLATTSQHLFRLVQGLFPSGHVGEERGVLLLPLLEELLAFAQLAGLRGGAAGLLLALLADAGRIGDVSVELFAPFVERRLELFQAGLFAPEGFAVFFDLRSE